VVLGYLATDRQAEALAVIFDLDPELGGFAHEPQSCGDTRDLAGDGLLRLGALRLGAVGLKALVEAV
jgi:hypothetical protein